jgi:hypothetical protein
MSAIFGEFGAGRNLGKRLIIDAGSATRFTA